jgi:hypothetical protein
MSVATTTAVNTKFEQFNGTYSSTFSKMDDLMLEFPSFFTREFTTAYAIFEEETYCHAGKKTKSLIAEVKEGWKNLSEKDKNTYKTKAIHFNSGNHLTTGGYCVQIHFLSQTCVDILHIKSLYEAIGFGIHYESTNNTNNKALVADETYATLDAEFKKIDKESTEELLCLLSKWNCVKERLMDIRQKCKTVDVSIVPIKFVEWKNNKIIEDDVSSFCTEDTEDEEEE